MNKGKARDILEAVNVGDPEMGDLGLRQAIGDNDFNDLVSKLQVLIEKEVDLSYKSMVEHHEAEIKELEKHDCNKWQEEGRGCSICRQTFYLKTVEEIKEIQEYTNAKIIELENRLYSRVEKPTKTLSRLCHDLGVDLYKGMEITKHGFLGGATPVINETKEKFCKPKDLYRFTECGHLRSNTIDSNCIHCNFNWCLKRIEYLEKPIDDKELLEAIRVQTEEYNIHYKDIPKEAVTEGYMLIGKTLQTLIAHAKKPKLVELDEEKIEKHLLSYGQDVRGKIDDDHEITARLPKNYLEIKRRYLTEAICSKFGTKPDVVPSCDEIFNEIEDFIEDIGTLTVGDESYMADLAQAIHNLCKKKGGAR